MAEGGSDGQRQDTDENTPAYSKQCGEEAQLPHKFLGLRTWLLRKETCQGINIKNRVLKRERLSNYKEERNPGSKQGWGQEEGLEREPWKREMKHKVSC